MKLARSSGVLLHIASLPSLGGIGDLGPAAHEFIKFLARAKQHVWQVLPLGPTGYGNSPYASTSAFAGNPLLISLELLRDWGWIASDRIADLPGPTGYVDFDAVECNKLPLLVEAARNFLDRGPTAWPDLFDKFVRFCRAQGSWLDDYAFYAVLRAEFGTGAWTEWPEPLKRRIAKPTAEARKERQPQIAVEQVLQFAFSLQWNLLREAAARSAIRILGDVAIFVNMDSADTWVHPELFELDADLRPIRVAGVPPDYFSPTGQRWGNPLYRWDEAARTNYRWWINRIRRATELYDIVRLDHFRGFEAYWAIPADEETAVNGQWIKGPGVELFQFLTGGLGHLPLVAEDLGVITPEVDALRLKFDLPGMKVLQFGFGDKGAHIHLPHRYDTQTVAYTGTHDNNTTQGWWQQAPDREKAAVEAYLGPVNGYPSWPLIRAANSSVASLAIAPAQDLLSLGAEARMNTPSVAVGNWSWRAPAGCWSNQIAWHLATLADAADRDNDPLARTGV